MEFNWGLNPHQVTREANTSIIHSQVTTIKKYMSTRKLFGLAKSAVQGHGQGFDVLNNTDPSSTHAWDWLVCVYNPYVSENTCVYRYRVWVTYYVEFFQRKQSLYGQSG